MSILLIKIKARRNSIKTVNGSSSVSSCPGGCVSELNDGEYEPVICQDLQNSYKIKGLGLDIIFFQAPNVTIQQ